MKEILRKNVSIKVPIPGVNEYPFEKAERWAKGYYHKARTQVSRRRAKEIKEQLPVKTADYCEKMTFGLWRLIGPPPGRPAKEAPLETTLEYLKPHTKPSKWGQFKPKFTKQLEQSFTAICNSDYNPAMVKEVNNSINQLLAKFAGEKVIIHLDFVLHPKKVEYLYSQRLLGITSRIWERLARIKLDLSKYSQPPRLHSPRQMEMHLDLSITR